MLKKLFCRHRSQIISFSPFLHTSALQAQYLQIAGVNCLGIRVLSKNTSLFMKSKKKENKSAKGCQFYLT